jgi:hypothetical protein
MLPPTLHSVQRILVRVITPCDRFFQVPVLRLYNFIRGIPVEYEITRSTQLPACHCLHRSRFLSRCSAVNRDEDAVVPLSYDTTPDRDREADCGARNQGTAITKTINDTVSTYTGERYRSVQVCPVARPRPRVARRINARSSDLADSRLTLRPRWNGTVVRSGPPCTPFDCPTGRPSTTRRAREPGTAAFFSLSAVRHVRGEVF